MRLLSRLDEQSSALILAHELAHLRRRDHLVRVVELIVSTIYWWNPLVGFLRRQIHESEELCCDAWVRSAFPDCAKSYAKILLKTAESLSTSQLGGSLLPATPFLRSLSLKARIEMILESRFAPCVSTRSRFMIALLALFILAPFVFVAPRVTRASSDDGPPSSLDRKPEAATTSGFPYKVPFEQGAGRLPRRRQDHDSRSPRHRQHLPAGQSLHDQGQLHSGVAPAGQAGCLRHRQGRRGPGGPSHINSRGPSSIRATAASLSSL